MGNQIHDIKAEKEKLIKIVTKQCTQGETEKTVMHTAAKITGTGGASPVPNHFFCLQA